MSNKKKTKKTRRKISKTQQSKNCNNTTGKLRQATALHNAGKLQEARKIYQDILTQEPNNPDALNLSGLIAGSDGDFDTAKKLITKAIDTSPQTPSFHCNLGLVHNDQGNSNAAQLCYKRAIELKPDYVEAYFHLGNALREQQREENAVENYRQALKYKPDHLPALHNMGNSLRDLGLFEQALSCYEQVIRLDPNQAIAYNNMGNTYKDMRKPQEAVACYQKATEIDPNNAAPYNNIGYILQRQGKLSAAIPWLNKALELQPDSSAALHNIGNIYKDMGDFDKAINFYRQALAITPCFPGAHSNILFAMNYAAEVNSAAMHQEATNWWQQQAANLVGQFIHANKPEPERRLKIGYISPDFFVHSVSFFFLTLLKAHDRTKVEIFCYSDVSIPDQMTEEIKNYSDQWRPILGLSDQAVAKQIHDDQIDIVVELAGHTANNRLLTLARQPAPIQVSWLGYPNTTGMPVIDYRLTDAIADPEGQTDQFYSEKLIRLEHGFLCYTPPQETPTINKKPKEKKITFGSFNNITKITPQVIKIWSEIIKQTSDSSLILKGITFADPENKARFFAQFSRHGIEPNRIILKERTESTVDHLNLYNEIDIGLDPFPYNGTTTTCEALWMGVPVISLTGEVHCSRVGASILTQLGLTDFIAQTEEEYIRKAIALAKDQGTLAKFRTSIRATMQDSPLCNPSLFADAMESVYRDMWRTWCTKQDKTTQQQTTQEDKIMPSPPPGTASHSKENLLKTIKSFPFWYHKIELPDGITTPGWAPIAPSAYRTPLDLTGKRVLDIGSWDGYWAFEALKRGAREVIAVDDFSDYLGELGKRDRKAWETFDLCKEALGYSDEVCKRVEMSLYDLKKETFGSFDIVFFFGTLYHLRYPLVALDILSEICKEEIFVESAILDDYSPYRGGLGNGYPNNQMVMEFYPNKEYGNNDSNWWTPTLSCMVNMLAAAGFVNCQGWKLTDTPKELSQCRGFANGKALR